MGQHRTKREKVEAQVHRLEKTHQYSLSDLGVSLGSAPSSAATHTLKTEPQNEDLKYTLTDLRKTLISTIVVFAMLAVGVLLLK